MGCASPDDPSSPFRGLNGTCFGMTELKGDEVVGGGGYCTYKGRRRRLLRFELDTEDQSRWRIHGWMDGGRRNGKVRGRDRQWCLQDRASRGRYAATNADGEDHAARLTPAPISGSGGAGRWAWRLAGKLNPPTAKLKGHTLSHLPACRS